MGITKIGAQASAQANLDRSNSTRNESGSVRAGVSAQAGLTRDSKIPEDISREIGPWKPKSITTDEEGRTVMALNSVDGLRIEMTPGGEECDGGPTRWEVTANDGTRRELTDEEKKALAQNLDRNISGHELSPAEDRAAREMLDQLVQDPAIDTRWDAPNMLKDLALSEGRVTDRSRGTGLALGRQEGPIERLTLTNGNSAELEVIRESAPNGPGSTPLFSKSIASGEYQHLVPLSRDEAVALRRNLSTQGPQNRETIRDLDRYIRSLDPSAANDTFERTPQRNQYSRYIG